MLTASLNQASAMHCRRREVPVPTPPKWRQPRGPRGYPRTTSWTGTTEDDHTVQDRCPCITCGTGALEAVLGADCCCHEPPCLLQAFCTGPQLTTLCSCSKVTCNKHESRQGSKQQQAAQAPQLQLPLGARL
jgi:hypothetical protein